MLQSIDRFFASANTDADSQQILVDAVRQIRLSIMSELDTLEERVELINVDAYADNEIVAYLYGQLRELDYVLGLVKQIKF